MANSFIKDIETYFDEVVEGFSATNLAAGVVAKYKADASQLSNTNNSFQRPVSMRTKSVDGLDLTGQERDFTDLTVPVALNATHLRNVLPKLQGVDLNNEMARTRIRDATVLELASRVDDIVASKIVQDATLLVKNSGNIDSYEDLAEAEAIMTEQQCDKGQRNIFLNPRMANNIASNLAARQTMAGFPTTAYTKSDVPDIAGFTTYRNQYMPSVTGSAGAGYLVNGADQDYTPLTTLNDIPVDNRTATLTVDTGTGAAVGDFFTIAGVNSVGQINKKDTGELRTFRIKAINSNVWTYSPPIVPADGTDVAQQDYPTTNTTPADNAAITILNTTTKKASAFYQQDAVELIHGDFNLRDFEAQGKVMGYAQTDSGLSIAMLCQSQIISLTSTYRFFIWTNPVVLRPECVGLYLEGQS